LAKEMMNALEAADLRDGYVTELHLHYDWGGKHSLDLVVKNEKNGPETIKLHFVGVTDTYISEDFKSQWISHCKVLSQPGRVYVSLDPYDETQEEDERDNYVIIAGSLERKN